MKENNFDKKSINKQRLAEYVQDDQFLSHQVLFGTMRLVRKSSSIPTSWVEFAKTVNGIPRYVLKPVNTVTFYHPISLSNSACNMKALSFLERYGSWKTLRKKGMGYINC